MQNPRKYDKIFLTVLKGMIALVENNTVQSVERTFALLELLCSEGALGVTELSGLSGLHKTTVYRLLSGLKSLGYVEKDPVTEKYSPTLKLLKLSSGLLSKVDMREYVRPYLAEIPKVTGETVHLVERSGSEIVYIDKFDSTLNSIRMVSRIGLSLPMVYTAVGKAILAHCADDEIKNIWDSTEIIKKTVNTITDFGKFMEEISAVRANGYALDREENEMGVCCVAAAIPDINGGYDYAFSVSAPASRMGEDKLVSTVRLVLETAKKIVELPH